MKYFALVLVAALCNTTSGNAEERFAIGFWYGPPTSANTLDTWQRVADAQFTLVGPCYGYEQADNLKLLAFCERVGLNAIVVDKRIRPEMVAEREWRATVRQVVADYERFPSLFGYYLHDEPSARWFPVLGEIHAEFRQRDPRRLPYINLLPNYAPANVLAAATQREYLRMYVESVHPTLLSYDHYPLLKTNVDRGDYFENLEAIRSVADAARVPVWSIVQVAPHEPYRDPTADELQWQVFTSLAYGVKGLLYFTYWPPPSLATSAIVDAEGNPTFRYDMVKEVNRKIHAIGPRLLALRSTAVYHTGSIPSGCTSLPSDAILRVPTDKPLIVGCFQDAGQHPFVMVVNRDYRGSQDLDVEVRSDVVGITSFDADDGHATDLPFNRNRFALHLRPGEGHLFKLQCRSAFREPFQPLKEIRFEFSEHDEDWVAAHSLTAPVVEQGELRSATTGQDPYFIRTFLALSPDRYRRLFVRMKTSGKKAQFYWQTAKHLEFDDARRVDFATVGDGEFHEYTIELEGHSGWKGQAIRAIRLDPSDGEPDPEHRQPVAIDYVRGE